jgi:hypothetical protein
MALSDMDDGHTIFQVELMRYFRSLIHQTAVIATIYCLFSLLGIGGETEMSLVASVIMVTFMLVAAIWAIGGGPGRLMRKMSQKLFKRKTRFKSAFQN